MQPGDFPKPSKDTEAPKPLKNFRPRNTTSRKLSSIETPNLDAAKNLAQGLPPARRKQAAKGGSSRKEISQLLRDERVDRWVADSDGHFEFDCAQNASFILPKQCSNTLSTSRQLTGHPRYDKLYLNASSQPDSHQDLKDILESKAKEIFKAIAKLETQCKESLPAQKADAQDPKKKLPSECWEGLTASHRELLHKHHDFLLTSQHPSASPMLQGLAVKYSIPQRTWKYGVGPFLKFFENHLPESMDYMLAFIHLAYQMMGLFYETFPAFEDTWIECLGDLGRYRMAIEDKDVRDRDTWAGVARSWYTKAADKNPIIGRLYHHLAILATPNALQQMYYYSRSLTCVKPFGSARESILTLLDPILGRTTASFTHALPIDTCFIKSHGLQFLGLSVKEEQTSEDFLEAKAEFLDGLSDHVDRITAKWKYQGACIAVINTVGFFGYGVDDNALRQAFLVELSEKAKKSVSSAPEESQGTTSSIDQSDPLRPSVAPSEMGEKLSHLTQRPTFKNARLLFNDTFALALRRIGDKNVLPHVNIKLSFIAALASNSYVSNLFDDLPWMDLIAFLNTLLKAETQTHQPFPTNQSENFDIIVAGNLFPADGERPDELPLPEDYLSRGLIWTHGYFPKNWFDRELEEQERYFEPASTVRNRINRVLRLGYALSKYNRWISYNTDTHSFKVISPAA